MECYDAERLIDAWLDRELSAEASAEVEAHLAECSVCRRRHAGLVKLLTAPEPVATPPELRDRVIAAAQALPINAPAVAAVRRYSLRRRYWTLGTGAIAASVAIFAMGWFGAIWFRQTAPIDRPVATPPQEPPNAVMLSPWVLSSWAQAVAMGGPVNPAASAAQATILEYFTAVSFEGTPVDRERRTAVTRRAPSDDAGALPLEIPVLPPVLRL